MKVLHTMKETLSLAKMVVILVLVLPDKSLVRKIHVDVIMKVIHTMKETLSLVLMDAILVVVLLDKSLVRKITCNQTCNYEGNTYNEGDSFPCKDGCNSCSCSSGQVSCTKNTCVSKTCCTNTDCDSGYFCALNSCEATQGTCTLIPAICIDQNDPVCGCDNQTYSHTCNCNSAGINVKSKGQC